MPEPGALGVEALVSLDTHCHLLPGIDDGARDVDESAAIAEALLGYGITRVVVTPHIHRDLYPNTRASILPVVAATQAELTRRGIPLQLVAGAEVRLDPESCTPDQWLTIGDGGTHMLVELPPGLPLVTTLEAQLFAIQAAGITPIIAHPERQGVFHKNPDLLARWVLERGMLAQGTLCALAGAAAEGTVRALEGFLQQGLIHVLGTDVHHLDRRVRDLTRAAARLETLVGPENARMIRLENPLALLEGRALQRPQPVPPASPPSLLQRLLATLRLP
jgi:protein-tyrosine phosphatase